MLVFVLVLAMSFKELGREFVNSVKVGWVRFGVIRRVF